MAQPAARSAFPSNILNPTVAATPSPAPLTYTNTNTNTNTPGSTGSNNNTFLMSASPVRSRRSAPVGYKPTMISTIGAKPACLVNASVTYVGDDQIYAFGGFDQYTDEGELVPLRWCWNGRDEFGSVVASWNSLSGRRALGDLL
jgi:hypothetical protein